MEPQRATKSPFLSAIVPGFEGWLRETSVLQDGTLLHDMLDPRTRCRVLFHQNRALIGAYAIDFHTVPDASDGAFHAAEHMLFKGVTSGLLFQSKGGLLAKEPVTLFSRWSPASESNAFTEADGVAICTTSPLQSDLITNFVLSLECAWFGSYTEKAFREEIWRHEQTGNLKWATLAKEINSSKTISDDEKLRLVQLLKRTRINCSVDSIERSDTFSKVEKSILISLVNKLREVHLNGIVLNEMLDYYADPEVVTTQGLMAALYPQTYFAYDSAGDPFEIPKLTPNKIRQAARFFHPSNSTIVIAGELDAAPFGKLLNSYLSCFQSKCFPNFNIPLEEQREFALDTAIAVPGLGWRGVMHAVGFLAKPARSPEHRLEQQMVGALLSSDQSPYLLAAADRAGLTKGIFSPLLPDTGLPVIAVGGIRGVHLEPDELKNSVKKAFVEATNEPKLEADASEFAAGLEYGNLSSSGLASAHVMRIAQAARRGNDPRFVADGERLRGVVEALGADPERLRQILREDFLDWGHVATVTGRQNKGAEDLWQRAELLLIKEHRRATPKSELANFFYADVGGIESLRAVRQLESMVSHETPDLRIPSTVSIHPRLSYLPGQPVKFHSVVSEVYSLRNIPFESLPWLGFLAESMRPFVTLESGNDRSVKLLDSDLGISPDHTGAPMPYLYVSRGFYQAPTASPLQIKLPNNDQFFQLLQSYLHGITNEIRQDANELAINHAWARTQLSGVLNFLTRGSESARRIEAVLERDRNEAIAHIEYLTNFLRTTAPLRTIICSKSDPSIDAFQFVEQREVAAPPWPLKIDDSLTSHVLKDAATSSVAICAELPWGSAVGRVVARYLNTETLWDEIRLKHSAYSTGVTWDPDWKLLTVMAGQMREPEKFQKSLIGLSDRLNYLKSKDIFERSRAGVIQELAGRRTIETWATDINAWEALPDSALHLANQLAELRALTASDFSRVAAQFERSIREASPVIVGPVLAGS